MNAFKIVDQCNRAIPLDHIDRMACMFWNVQYDKKHYASPFGLNGSNWFDVIGWHIANQLCFTSGWNNVLVTMVSASLQWDLLPEVTERKSVELKPNEKIFDSITQSLEYLSPFIKFMNYLNEHGYKPIKIEE